jgi:pyrroline-5-carboxylate reductase
MRVGFIGAGNMARALARGLGEPVLCTESGSGRARALADELGGEALASNRELAERAEIVILAHKPVQLVAGTMRGTAELLHARGVDTLQLRREVTSPGGTTSRGLAALERGGVRAAFHAVVDG